MFDVGFQELLLLGIVALLVVGPERLPHLARTLGLWIRRSKQMLSNIKQDIDAELKADELKKILELQKQSNPLDEIIEETQHQMDEVKQNITQPTKKD